MNEPTYLKTDELATRWRKSVNALYKMRARGDGPPFTTMPGGSVLYDLSDIEE